MDSDFGIEEENEEKLPFSFIKWHDAKKIVGIITPPLRKRIPSQMSEMLSFRPKERIFFWSERFYEDSGYIYYVSSRNQIEWHI